MKKLVFIKIGGSLITDKHTPFTAKPEVIAQFAQDFAQVIEENPNRQFVLGNGVGSFGHYPVMHYKLQEGMSSPDQLVGFGEVNDSVTRLNSLVVQALHKKRIPVCSLNPSSLFTAEQGKVKTAHLDSMFGMLERAIIPIVYGNIIFDEAKGCTIFSTEKIFEVLIDEMLLRNVTIDRVIHLTVVDGVLDEEKSIIPVIAEDNKETIKKHIFQTEGFDVTGGMWHKIEKSLYYAGKGITTSITNGNDSRWKTILSGAKGIGTEIISR